MKKLYQKFKHLTRFIPDSARVPLALCLLTDLLAYYLPRLIGLGELYDFSLPLDARIPAVPAFTYVYILAFPYWAANYILISRQNDALGWRLFRADAFAKAVCLVCFLAIPSTIVQPAKESLTGPGAWLLKLVYALDEPNNLLPSIHCFVSWMAFRPLLSRECRGVKRGYVVFSGVFSLLVCLSTLFTRQHVIWDMVTGIAVAEMGWLLSGIQWKKKDC